MPAQPKMVSVMMAPDEQGTEVEGDDGDERDERVAERRAAR